MTTANKEINTGTGSVVVRKRSGLLVPEPKRRELVLDSHGIHLKSARLEVGSDPALQQRILAFLRDRVHSGIPSAWYKLTVGHDLQLSMHATLSVRHFHASERSPFTGELGWLENLGILSHKKVTTAFRDLMVDNLVSDTTAWGDFKFQSPGTSNQAESNADTALIAVAGPEATGTQLEGATSDIYKSVATVTADASETWEEHQIRNVTGATGGTMMDRSLATVVVVNLDTVEYTYQLTVTAEA